MPPKYELFDKAGNVVESRDYTADEIKAVAKAELCAMDSAMIRVIEDLYEVLSPSQKAALPAEVAGKITKRKALRDSLSR